VKNNKTPTDDRNALRLLKLLSKQIQSGFSYENEGEKIVIPLKEKAFSFNLSLIKSLTQKRIIVCENNKIKITQQGALYIQRILNPDALLASSQSNTAIKTVNINGENQKVEINSNESPLMRLFSRKTKTGTTYISFEEFQAGERLRKDFERGQLQPKVSANLLGNVGSSGNAGFGDASDITDFAFDARKRVGEAIDKLGPELSGVTLDICCFLKGLENVERERHWPPRSAKLMLKTALSLLARHYGIVGYENRRANKIQTWGSRDYRPAMKA